MKKLLLAALVIGVIASVVNDVGRYLGAIGRLDAATSQVAQAAASAGRKDKNRTQPGGRAAVAAAQERGILLYGYQVEDNEIQVWTSDEVEGTWVAGPFLAWQAGKPLHSSFQITDHDTAFFN